MAHDLHPSPTLPPPCRTFFLDACLKLALYQPRSSGPRASTPLQAAQMLAPGPAQPGGAAADPAPLLPAPGLSPADMRALEEKGVPGRELLARRKMGEGVGGGRCCWCWAA